MSDEQHNADGTPVGEQPANEPSGQQTEEKLYSQRELDARLNGLMTTRFKRFENSIQKQIADAIASAKGAPPPPQDPDQAAAMQALQAMRAEREAERVAASERERTLLDREIKSEVEHTLTQLGSHNAKGARALLADEDRVKHNSDGQLVFIGDDGAEVPLADGLRAWLNSDIGKNYLPPRGGGAGSATVFRGGGRPGASPPSKQAQRSEALGVLSQFVLGGGRK